MGGAGRGMWDMEGVGNGGRGVSDTGGYVFGIVQGVGWGIDGLWDPGLQEMECRM